MSDAPEPSASSAPGDDRRTGRRQLRSDLTAAVVALVLVAVFWVQRDYREPLSGAFPDFVLIALTVLAVLLVGMSLLRSRNGAAEPDPAAADPVVEEPGSAPAVLIAASMALLGAWVVLLTPLGFTPGGIIAFAAITVFVRRRSFQPKHLLVDVPVAIAVVWISFLVFTRVLLVLLPVPPFISG